MRVVAAGYYAGRGGVMDALACVELWYNRNARSWVVQWYDRDGLSTGSDYAGTKDGAESIAQSYGVPIARTNTYGERAAKRAGDF